MAAPRSCRQPTCLRMIRITMAGSTPMTRSPSAPGFRAGMVVADFCAGLGGPARYFAHRYGVRVTGVDLNARRVEGARRLNSAVGLEAMVDMRQADVTSSGLPSTHFDAVVSQEALLHVPDKAAVLDEAYRVLKPGGRLVFTDWTSHRALSAEDAETLWQGLAAQTLRSPTEYEALLEGRRVHRRGHRGSERRVGGDPRAAFRHVHATALGNLRIGPARGRGRLLPRL